MLGGKRVIFVGGRVSVGKRSGLLESRRVMLGGKESNREGEE